MGLRIEVEGFIKDRHWFGFRHTRKCLYFHRYDDDCNDCKKGKWVYANPNLTGLKFGELLDEHNTVYKDMGTITYPFKRKKK